MRKFLFVRNFTISQNNKDILKNFVLLPNSNIQRLNKMTQAAFRGFRDPEDADHVSNLGDLSSYHILKWWKIKLEDSEEGREILSLKPRVTSQTLNFEKLKKLPVNSLGYQYFKYMEINKFSPDERPLVKYIPDLELAYLLQRYKETHDFYHVLLNYGRTVVEEIAVKWFEGIHLRLPSSCLSGLFAPFSLSINDNINLYTKYLPHVIENADKSNFILKYYFENRIEQDLDDLRKEINITPLL
jgi:ubiquinone biosynthesis protein COQ4